MVSFNFLLIMNAHHTCIPTDKIQQTDCSLAAMHTTGIVTCETFSKGSNIHSGQTTQPDEHRGTLSQTTIGEGYRHLPLTRSS
jgi:hypothetical protein